MKKKVRSRQSTSKVREQRKSQVDEIPSSIYKKNFMYLKGTVELSSYGIHHVMLENDMKAICTCRKLETFYKVSLMMGDRVLVELDPLNLNPNETLRGRVVWRMKGTRVR